MDILWTILGSVLMGALVGWAATFIFGSKGSLIKYIIIGIVGGALGGFLASLIGIGGAGGFIVNFLIAVAGAGILIIVLRFFKIIK